VRQHAQWLISDDPPDGGNGACWYLSASAGRQRRVGLLRRPFGAAGRGAPGQLVDLPGSLIRRSAVDQDVRVGKSSRMALIKSLESSCGPGPEKVIDASHRIRDLDLSLFDNIPTQTTKADQRALLGVQRAVMTKHEQFTYLEIGSHLGGSIQPYLVNPTCKHIYSIDPRPLSQPDDREKGYVHH
jgi:hypothetical protein